ncbi:MAG TPA: hypothetical protein GXX53_02780 [Tissierellia bacterium]|nr:hypothetical protein [Tissierellia bacterium]
MAVINVTPEMDITALINSNNVNEGDVLLLEEGIYFQTVAVIKSNIRIVAKGPGVIFDGRSILLDAFILPDMVGVMIKGVNIRHYRASGILIEFGLGHRIINNKISNMLEHGIEVMGSSSNLIWKNKICNCHDGVLLISGSTNNWVIDNIAKDCFEDGFESVLGPDSNNAFISNKAIRSRFHGLDVYGSNNLILNNILLDNGLGIIINQGSGSIAIGNMIKGTKHDTYIIFNGYFNHFVGENNMVCNRRVGIENNGQFNVFMNNEISYNGDTGLLLGSTSVLNFVKDNKLVCNIPENIDDRGIDNWFLNNKEKPCEPCQSPVDVCGECPS